MSYHRVNIDGRSVTETRIAAAALLPGTFAIINGSDKFEQAGAGTKGRMYVLNPSYHEGLTIDDEIPKDGSAVGEYVEEGRELAVLCAAGTYAKDTPITINASGQGVPVDTGTNATYQVVGFAQDALTIAGGKTDFVRIRVRADSVVVTGN